MARIIYVEDDDLMGHVVQEVLTQAGHLIGVVPHGTLGFETIAFKKPELVILDLGLPGMTGIEVLKHLRQISSTYMIPILVLTANQSAEAAEQAMGAGANDVMLKPFVPADLIARVADVLSVHGFGNDLIRRDS
ncbi:response regulator [Sphingomonas radiodurans]|uniref:response regulator n=1 Tax=Sphingomonas radiodurans TaxID=2890321 RepID=UPI001E360B99|nr:response regulator [Sphingomonas radiodurans]WBH15814.1 response regulator [Sphingomonas radiodurans]